MPLDKGTKLRGFYPFPIIPFIFVTTLSLIVWTEMHSTAGFKTRLKIYFQCLIQFSKILFSHFL